MDHTAALGQDPWPGLGTSVRRDGGTNSREASPTRPRRVAAAGRALLVVLMTAALPTRADIPGATIRAIPTPAGTSFPSIAGGPDGRLWAVDAGNVPRVGWIGPDGSFDGFALAGPFGPYPVPRGVVAGPDGNVWITVLRRNDAKVAVGSQIGRVTTSGSITVIDVPTANAFEQGGGLAVGSDGNVWFTEITVHKIGRVTPAGSVTEFPLPSGGIYPGPMVLGPDGNLWFTEGAAKVGRITTQGAVTEFRVPITSGISTPSGIAAGPDGNLWFTDNGQNSIRSVTPQGAFSAAIRVPTASAAPFGIVSGPDGNLYFTELFSRRIGRLVPSTSAIDESGEPLGRQPVLIVRAPSGFARRAPDDGLVRLLFNAVNDDGDFGLGELDSGTSCGLLPPPTGIGGKVGLSALIVSWDHVESPDVEGYEVEVSTHADFSTITDSAREGAGERSAELTNAYPETSVYYIRVRTIRRCATGGLAGPWSATVPFGTATARPSIQATKVVKVDDRTQRVTATNRGGTASNVLVFEEPDASVDVDFDPPAHFGWATGETRDTTVRLRETDPGLYLVPLLFGDPEDPLASTVPLAFTLPPSPVADGSRTGFITIGGVGTIRVTQSLSPPPAQDLSIGAGSAAPAPIYPFLSFEPPDVPVLKLLDPAAAGQALPVSGSVRVPVTLDMASFVRRARLGTTFPTSLRGAVVARPLGGSETTVLPFYTAPAVSPSQGAGRAMPPPGGSSVVVPAVVNGENPAFGVTYSSDLLLRNGGASDRAVDLYYTPDGADGLSSPGVLKLSLTIPAASTLLLHDVVGTYLGTTGSGQLEIRASDLRFLDVRSTTEAETGGDATRRFGTEIPAVAYGAGAGVGASSVVVGVSEDDVSRTNLILSETTGRSLDVRVTVRDEQGAALGEATRSLPPYGKVQISGVVGVVRPGARLGNGSIQVEPISGAGKVAALATVLDNRSNSFSAVAGVEAPSGAGTASDPLVVPAAARLTGALGVRYTTSLRLANGSPAAASLSLTYRYLDVASGQTRSVTKPLTVPALGSLPRQLGDDVVATLFGLTAETYGWIEVRGDTAGLSAVAAVSSLVDPNDATKGLKTAPVLGLRASSREVLRAPSADFRFGGVEKSRRKRTNLVVVETAGQPGRALVGLRDRQGGFLGLRTYDLAPYEYLQITDVLGSVAGAAGDGTLLDVSVAVRNLSPGGARLVSFASVIDNVSANPEIFVLRP